jgi:2,3-bisphosphoglycerate-dependent phosphoglycerate mutase
MRNSNDQERRHRLRRRRFQIIVIYTAIAVGLAWFFESQATTTIIFVRHAEQTSRELKDPELSEAGHRRVSELTRQLVDADVVAGIDAIYSTPLRRSLATAEPLAEQLDLPINQYAIEDKELVLENILKNHKGEIILVIAHGNTLPDLIANLGASKNVPTLASEEFDNIYLVSIPWFGKTKTIRLRYGVPYVSAEAT